MGKQRPLQGEKSVVDHITAGLTNVAAALRSQTWEGSPARSLTPTQGRALSLRAFINNRRGAMRQRHGLSACVLSLMMMAGSVQVADGAQAKSLYDRLGGKGAITAVVDTFVGNVGGDARINGFFGSTDLTKLKLHLVNQICEASGGPCQYTGRTMKQTHAGMGVHDAAFGALVEDLVAALDHHKVGKAEKDELLGVLDPMKSDIVEKQ